MIAYHGTRHYSGGDLQPYSIQNMKLYIDRLLRKLNLNFNEWLKRGYFASQTINELENEKRRKIWVTDNEATAYSYATRSPELAWHALMDAIDNILWNRRWRRSNLLRLCKERNDWIQQLLEGEPLVLVLDIPKTGFNFPVDFVSEEQIIGIHKQVVIPERTTRKDK